MTDLQSRIDKLEKELAEYKRNRFYALSSEEVEKLKAYIFDRTAATLASGAVVKYMIVTYNGVRRAIPYYNKFQALV